jgi:hypothetical protein
MTGSNYANPWRILRGGSIVDQAYLIGPVTREIDPLDVEALRAHPGADLDCLDGTDLDCDGLEDMDEDADGYITVACPAGDDCDDADASIHPGAALDCSAVDHDCNGHPDRDDDGDGAIASGCGGGDCDDSNPEIHPDHEEILCNGIDDNCDGYFSPAEDHDIDGHISLSCGGDDCDDRDSSIHPGADDACNGIDDDCDDDCDDAFACCQNALDDPCTTPSGHPGMRDCTDLCTWTACCSQFDHCDNGHDDDCDGHTDEQEVLIPDTRISSLDSGAKFPAATWTGSEVGIMWQDDREGNDELFFTRLDAHGTPVEDPIRATFTPEDSWFPALIWTGSRYAFVWYDAPDGDHPIYFGQMDALGIRTGPDVAVISGAGSAQRPDIEWTGSEFGVAWWTSSAGLIDVFFRRLRDDGTSPMSPLLINESPAAVGWLSLAWTGSEYAVAWSDSSAIYISRVTADGVRIGTSIRASTPTTGAWDPSLVWDGSGYAVAWEDERYASPEIMVARVVVDSPVWETRVTDSDGSSRSPDILATGSEYRLVYADGRYANLEILLSRISTDGTPIGSTDRITFASWESWDPRVTWMGPSAAVTWWDARDGVWAVYFAQVGCL